MSRLMMIGAVAICCVAAAQPPRERSARPVPAAPEDKVFGLGVPLSLALDRAQRVSNLRYNLHFDVPAEVTTRISGTATIGFTLKDATRPLVLDFSEPGRLEGRIGGRTVSLAAADDHIVIPAADLREGANEITIEFVAGDASLNRNPDFMYTLFVPARARLAFPCFDQPDLKGRYTLSLEVPERWEALGNGAETERTHTGGRTRIAFAETEPLPTYLFAFAAGRFQVEAAERNGRRFRMFHRETDAAKVARNRDAVFDLHAAALAWLERYTNIKYPFGKFDFLLVPSFQFGGMEHAGAIFYNASGLLLDQSATQNQKLARASVIAHETAHMWFGDLVTMRWFDDVWMKEVFANFMAAKIVNPSFPGINHELRFLLSHYPAAYDVDRTAGTNPIRQPLENLNQAGALYGAIIYQKAPIIMRQLETIVGEEAFRDGLREYLNAHAFGNATWADLIHVLDARTVRDLDAWSRAWVDEAGRPDITTQLRTADGHITSLGFSQKDPVLRRGLVWTQQMEITLGYDTEARRIPVTLNAPRVEVAAARGLPAPQFVLPTGSGLAYGGFALDPATREYLLHHLPDISNPLTRGSATVTLWEDMLDGRANAAAVIDILVAALPREQDELNLQRMLDYTVEGYWKFLRSGAREAIAPALEQVLRSGLDTAATPSLKSAWFSALRDVAQTPPTLNWLERVWREAEKVPGLVLEEPDYITLAQQLAVRGVAEWADILDAQFGRIQNPDRKARFAFVRPSLSTDRSVRDPFFRSLASVENRRREPWVIEALSYLHHPLRAAASLEYIPPSLSMLEEIQRTGDIFFPKRWVDATLSGHSSASAALMVRTFVAGLPPDYPDRLRRIVLSSADDLLRASR